MCGKTVENRKCAPGAQTAPTLYHVGGGRLVGYFESMLYPTPRLDRITTPSGATFFFNRLTAMSTHRVSLYVAVDANVGDQLKTDTNKLSRELFPLFKF